MAVAAVKRRGATRAIGWLATGLGLLALIAAGFLLGLVVGVVSEEPELVVGHMAGRTREVAWAGPRESAPAGHAEQGGESTPDVAAAAPPTRLEAPRDRAARRPEPLGPAPRYQIQVGAFADAASAERVAGQLREGGYPVRVLEPAADDRWRVRVGPVEGREKADQVARRLKAEEQLPTWVLREQGS